VDIPASVKQKEEFIVKVSANGARDLFNAAFAVTYDLKKLELVGQREGEFLKQGGAKTNFQAFPDRKKGEVWLALSRIDAANGATGNGVLASVTFRAIAPGSAPIGIVNPNFTGPAGTKLEVVPYNAAVEVK
jgi:general secretion pathway protein D